MSQIVAWKLNCVDFVMRGQKGEQLKSDSIDFVIEEDKVLFAVICAF